MVKRYKNVGMSRLEFPDGQEVLPGQEFERDYDPDQEWAHKVGGAIEELVNRAETDEEPEKEG